jgi:hypothetical protein
MRLHCIEGLSRDPEWKAEPGGAVFPEGELGPRDAVGYAEPRSFGDPLLLEQWEATVHARYRGERRPPNRDLPRIHLSRNMSAAVGRTVPGRIGLIRLWADRF